ncbi:hypothetical protein [Xenococcus sp. PCC 7305]|nr:hypothetical protein [Xenococcus sp. PCC 7305]
MTISDLKYFFGIESYRTLDFELKMVPPLESNEPLTGEAEDIREKYPEN